MFPSSIEGLEWVKIAKKVGFMLEIISPHCDQFKTRSQFSYLTYNHLPLFVHVYYFRDFCTYSSWLEIPAFYCIAFFFARLGNARARKTTKISGLYFKSKMCNAVIHRHPSS